MKHLVPFTKWVRKGNRFVQVQDHAGFLFRMDPDTPTFPGIRVAPLTHFILITDD